MAMPARKFNNSAYRYGMNGQEKDNEVFEGATTAEYWEYDSRTGRRWETDPVSYPWQSPYATFNNNPIYFADPDGLKGDDVIKAVWNDGKGEYDRTKVSDEYGPDVTLTNYEGGAKDGVNEVLSPNGLWSNGGSSGKISNIPKVEYSSSDWDDYTVASDGSPQDWKVMVNSGVNILNSGINLINSALHPKETYNNLKNGVVSTIDYLGTNSVKQVAKDAWNGVEKNMGDPNSADAALSWGLMLGAPTAPLNVINKLPLGKYANHVFSGRAGKFLDTPTNRSIIERVSNITKNYMGVDANGKAWWAEVQSNGSQVYSYTQNGVVKGAGINSTVVDIVKTQKLE